MADVNAVPGGALALMRELELSLGSGDRDPLLAALRGDGERALRGAAAAAPVGLELPPMSQLTGWKRAFARAVARAVLRLAQVVTHGQRTFNRDVVEALATLAERVRRQEARTIALEREVVTQTSLLAHDLDLLRDELAAACDGRASATAQLVRQLEYLRREVEALRAAAASPLDDQAYARFEARFRGSRAEIGRRVAVYLEPLRRARAGSAERPILELGCGRGELLELLTGESMVARGVDTSPTAVAGCKQLGLEVCHGDALVHVAAQPSSSLGAVVALHLLEHLPGATALALLREAVRALQPEGVLIVECPNPENLVVGASSFYIDPSHRRPVHPQFLRFVFAELGIPDPLLLELHPIEVLDEGVERAQQLLFGPQDFALIGFRSWVA